MTVPQNIAALHVAQARRLELAAFKRDLRSNPGTLTDIMRDPPPVIHGVLLIDVIRWTRSAHGNGPAITEIGRRALRAHINLMSTVRDATLQARMWVAENGALWATQHRHRHRDTRIITTITTTHLLDVMEGHAACATADTSTDSEDLEMTLNPERVSCRDCRRSLAWAARTHDATTTPMGVAA